MESKNLPLLHHQLKELQPELELAM